MIQQAHNLDHVDLTAGLSNALTRSFKDKMSAFKLMASSPYTNIHKNLKEIQTVIVLLIDEIKGLKELNADGDFDDELDDERVRLKELQN